MLSVRDAIQVSNNASRSRIAFDVFIIALSLACHYAIHVCRNHQVLKKQFYFFNHSEAVASMMHYPPMFSCAFRTH